MFYQAQSYIGFIRKATNHHGVHSPFVYDVVTQCLYDKQNYPEYQILKNHRKALLKDTSKITVTDFGKGSRVFKLPQRKIAQIAQHAGVTVKRQKLLFKLAQYFQPKNSLELGTSLGMGTLAMALGYPKGMVYTIEGCPQTAFAAQKHWESYTTKNIQLQVMAFEAFFKSNTVKTFDLVYLDGHHDGAKTLDYFEALQPFLGNNSVLILDDIYWSLEMTQAWQQIVNDPRVTVSMDTYQWGLVWFRREQQKEHFTIRV